MMREARAIDRRLRRRIRPLLRASPSLWAEYKKARRARRPPLAMILLMPFTFIVGMPMLFFGVPVFLAWRCVEIGGTDYLLAASGWSSLVVALFIAWLTQLALFGQTQLLALLPIADSAIARRAQVRVLIVSLFFVVLVIHPFAFAAWYNGMPVGGWVLAI